MDIFDFDSPADKPGQSTNAPELSVSEVAQAVKRTVETAFDHVRIRGEISRPNYHRSGHLYLTLKDEKAVIDAVCWRGAVSKLSVRAEEGMEVIVTGRLTTFPGGSKYQVVIEKMELAGEGALLKLLEDRRKKLAAEGLFDANRKQPLPYLPQVIGVVTSPTGAVIRDILHRVSDRFPRHVILWPVAVQGEKAAASVAEAIRGFNALPSGGSVPKPDVLIVGRGGGSLEDLWGFNEEVVVRAVAESSIPVISAVGHETDTTLIDFVSDKRAPTPTGAAEMAVPVRSDLLLGIEEFGARLGRGLQRRTALAQSELAGLARGLGEPQRLIDDRRQTLDVLEQRLDRALETTVQNRQARLETLSAKIRHPRETLTRLQEQTAMLATRLANAAGKSVASEGRDFASQRFDARMQTALERRLRDSRQTLDNAERLLKSFAQSRDRLLEQGYIFVTDADGNVVREAKALSEGQALTLNFKDDQADVVVGKGSKPAKPAKTKSKPTPDGTQGSLL